MEIDDALVIEDDDISDDEEDDHDDVCCFTLNLFYLLFNGVFCIYIILRTLGQGKHLMICQRWFFISGDYSDVCLANISKFENF